MKSCVRVGLAAAFMVLLAACASAPNIDSMVATEPSATVPEEFRGSIAVESVTGGKTTNPMWATNLSSDEFKGALVKSLENAGLLSQLATGGKYRLRVTLEELNQPFAGLDMTVSPARSSIPTGIGGIVVRSASKCAFRV